MPFSLSAAISGAGQGIADVGGEMIRHGNQVDLLRVRHENDLIRDAAIARLNQETHAANETFNTGQLAERGRIGTEVEVAREEATRPGRLKTYAETTPL